MTISVPTSRALAVIGHQQPDLTPRTIEFTSVQLQQTCAGHGMEQAEFLIEEARSSRGARSVPILAISRCYSEAFVATLGAVEGSVR